MPTVKGPKSMRHVRTSFDPSALQQSLHRDSGTTKRKLDGIYENHAVRRGNRIARCNSADRSPEFATPADAEACRVDMVEAGYEFRVVRCAGARRHWHLKPVH